MSDTTVSPAPKEEKGPSFSSCSVGSFRDECDHTNCCWCGAIIGGLKYDSKTNMNKAVKRFCPKCGKPNIIQFHWSVTIESTPDTR